MANQAIVGCVPAREPMAWYLALSGWLSWCGLGGRIGWVRQSGVQCLDDIQAQSFRPVPFRPWAWMSQNEGLKCVIKKGVVLVVRFPEPAPSPIFSISCPTPVVFFSRVAALHRRGGAVSFFVQMVSVTWSVVVLRSYFCSFELCWVLTLLVLWFCVECWRW
jgi:hypothetical protein